jgi:hypothetical protein
MANVVTKHRATDPGCASQVARRARRINLENFVPA